MSPARKRVLKWFTYVGGPVQTWETSWAKLQEECMSDLHKPQPLLPPPIFVSFCPLPQGQDCGGSNPAHLELGNANGIVVVTLHPTSASALKRTLHR